MCGRRPLCFFPLCSFRSIFFPFSLWACSAVFGERLGRERERERERQRERQRQTDRQTDRQTETDRQRQTDTDTDRQRQSGRQTDRQTGRDRETDRDRNRPTVSFRLSRYKKTYRQWPHRLEPEQQAASWQFFTTRKSEKNHRMIAYCLGLILKLSKPTVSNLSPSTSNNKAVQASGIKSVTIYFHAIIEHTRLSFIRPLTVSG